MSLPLLRRSMLSSTLRSARLSAPSQLLLRRTVANTTSNRPGSQSLNQAALNVKEETGNLASDAAKTIAGANMADHSAGVGTKGSFVRGQRRALAIASDMLE